MGCTHSMDARGDRIQRKKKSVDPHTRDGTPSIYAEKDTTASGRHSTRYSPTIWDVQLEKERKTRMRTGGSSACVTPMATPRASPAQSDRFFMVSQRQNRYGMRDQRETPRNRKQGMIPSWNQVQIHPFTTSNSKPLSRSNSWTGYSQSSSTGMKVNQGSLIAPSPSNRSSVNVNIRNSRNSVTTSEA